MKAIKQVAEDLITWSGDLLDEIVGKYEYPPEYKDKGLPDIACEIITVQTREVESGEGFRMEQLEQRRIRVYVAELIIMVDPEPPDTASNFLADSIDTLTGSLDSGELKRQFSYVGKDYSASFRPPFIEFDDGTRGRQATLRLEVGERI